MVGFFNTYGSSNTFSGTFAGYSNATGSNNTFIGNQANSNAGTYANGTALGSGATLTASNSIVLGNAAISRIYAKVTTITAISDRRRKKDIAALPSDHPATDAICLVQSFYATVIRLSAARGTDADRPRHLQKITRTR